MPGIAVKLPLSRDYSDGYTSIRKINEMIQQNLKMILLTSPGERVMKPGFGVGLRKYLFKEKDISLVPEIRANIYEQVNIYMKKINLLGVEINGFEGELADTNYIKVILHYSIPLISPRQDFTLEIKD
jgi:phage baseplate assembly protein W